MRQIFFSSAAVICFSLAGLPANAATFTCTWLENTKPVGTACKIDTNAHTPPCTYIFSTKMPVACQAAPYAGKTLLECIFQAAGSKPPATITMEGTLEDIEKAMHAMTGYYSGAIAMDVNADITLLVGVKENGRAPEIDARCMP